MSVSFDLVGRTRPSSDIAVIGTGIAGMSAAWLLSQRHNVTVYELSGRIGGHSNTVMVSEAGGEIPVDTGFIVYNEVNYPNLVQLFRHLGVPTRASDMSFAASLDDGQFEYSGTDLNGLIGQRRNVFRLRFWTLLRDILRFYKEAPAILSRPDVISMTLGEYLAENGYSAAFTRDHILPMGAAIWSTTVDEMLDYPVAAFVRFFESHGLLKIEGRPEWRTVDGGSQEYVRRLTADYADRVRLSSGVRSLTRRNGRVYVLDATRTTKTYDHVVVATHADEALALLGDADGEERRQLGAFGYSANRAVLHRDMRLMPKRRRVWSSWNFLGGEGDEGRQLCVTYWMNRLQGVKSQRPLFVTLNPRIEPAANSFVAEFQYTHPLFNLRALSAQNELWSLQGRRNTWFCGSYFGSGFHEDALQAGLAVAEDLGGMRRPWRLPEDSGRIQRQLLTQAAAE